MLNFETVCRTCSLQGELQSLFIEDVLLNPAEMLTEIVDIKVIKGDKYPQNICTRCLDALKSAYLFKNQCHEVYKKFDQFLSLNPENKTIVDCKDELINFIKEENQIDRSENDDEWFGVDDGEVNTVDEKFKCHKCNKKLKNQKSYKRHLKRHEQFFACPICNDQFSSKFKLEKHSRIHFSEKRFKCEYCEKSYKRKQQLDCHMTLKHEEIYTSIESSDQTVTKPKLIQKRKLLCDFCGRAYIDASKLKDHIRTHTGEKPFSCVECNRFFTSQTILNQHKRIHHSNEKPHKCDYCGKSFALSKWLKQHLMIHTNEKPFTCDICNQKFRQSQHLSRHKFIHTGEKPFSCNECNKFFSSQSLLSHHRRIHHSNEKPHKCDYCGKCFAISRWLKQHLLIHTNDKPFTCDICNQKFRQKSTLSRHMLTHTGEKPFSCNICDKKFTQSSHLRAHMRTHTGEKPYVCSICCKGFHDPSSMKNHWKKHNLFNNEESQNVSSVSNTEK